MNLKPALRLLVSALFVAEFVAAVPASFYSDVELGFNSSSLFDDVVPELSERQNAKAELRILPLGASIVNGYDATDKNGFRKHLRNQLRFKGWLVNMVGSKQGGDMVDRNFEATGGDTIDQVRTASRLSMGFKPNVILINAGTNDANTNLQVGAGSRMEGLLRDLWNADGMTNSLVILSSVLARSDANAENNRLEINKQYISLVNRLRAEGRPIRYQEMPLSMPRDFKQDGIHPNDAGFKIMAKWWWVAIEYAYQAGLIKEAAPFSGISGTTCEKVAGQASYGGITQKGSGVSDGIYYHNSEEKGILWSYTSEFDRDQWFFARLYGQKYDDLTGWWIADGVVTWATWKNIGGGKFSKVSDMTTSLFCNPRGVFWVDLNADGYDDFLCVAPSGDTQASINNRDGTATKPPTFTFIGVIKTHEGYLQDRVRWGDIDGDGRADYCVLDDGGNVWVWRNAGTSDKPAFWQAMGMRFTAKGMGDMRGVRFEDINGDGRDDWLWVNDAGQTTTWTNSRSCQSGRDGDGLNVAWRQGFWKGASSGPTHAGVGSTSRDRIHFGRIYSEPYFGLLGRADYIYMQSTKQADGRFKFDMKVWKNTGGGASKLEADGNKYCNMHGHADGRMDYVTTLSSGQMTVYPNLGKKSVSGDEVFWNTPKDMFNPNALIGKSLDRRDLHLVDWNNDGACDIVWTDPDNNNRVSVWLNTYKTTGAFTWTYLANPAPILNCPEKRGLGIHDLAVRWGDINGNGLSDYLCLEPNGRTWGYVHNTDGSWTYIDQFKKAEGIDRANMVWADVNGDGRDDLIWIDKWNGDGIVYINNGRLDTGGSRYWFLKKGKQYDGSWAGTCQYFPDLDGDGRADLHSIMGTFTNRAETFFNRCGLFDLTGDDAGWAPGQDPGMGPLPPYEEPSEPSEPYTPDPNSNTPLKPCSYTPDTMEEIFNLDYANELPAYCVPGYMIPVLNQMLADTTKRYNEILNSGYDGYFNVYADFLVENSFTALQTFQKDKGEDFFDCRIWQEYPCCTACAAERLPCIGCIERCNIESPQDDGHEWHLRDQPCPPDYSGRGMGDDWKQSIFWSFKDNSAKDKFYEEAAAEVGAPVEKFKTTDHTGIPSVTISYPCAQDLAAHGWDGMNEICKYEGYWFDTPVIDGFQTSDVNNPKDIVEKALKTAEALKEPMGEFGLAIMAGDYAHDEYDLVDALILPVFMLQEAISYMETVVQTAKDITKANRDAFIVNLISGLLIVVGFGGSILGSVGMRALGRILLYLAEAGNTGIGIYAAVSTPESAPLTIFGLIMSGRGIRDYEKVARAATIRRTMTFDEISTFSKDAARQMEQVAAWNKKPTAGQMCRWG